MSAATVMKKPKSFRDLGMSDTKTMKSLSTELVAVSKGTMLAPKEVIQSIERLAPEAVSTLEELMTTSKADSVRLKAALEVLALAGINKETKVSIKTETHDMGTKEIDSRLAELLGTAAGTVIEHEEIDITPSTEEDED